MIKYLTSIAVLTTLISCGKENTYSNDFTAINYVNTAPAASGFSTSSTFFINNTQATESLVVYGANSGYRSWKVNDNFTVEARSNEIVSRILATSAQSTGSKDYAQSYFLCDSLTTATGTLKLVKVMDTLTKYPAGDSFAVRIFNLNPTGKTYNVIIISFGNTSNDTLRYTNLGYLGTASAANITSLQAFKPLRTNNHATRGMRIYLYDGVTNNFIDSSFVRTYAQMLPTKLNTFYLVGGAVGQPLQVGTFRNY